MTLQWVRNRDGKDCAAWLFCWAVATSKPGGTRKLPGAFVRLLHLQRSHRLLHYRQRVPLPQICAGAYLSGALQIFFR